MRTNIVKITSEAVAPMVALALLLVIMVGVMVGQRQARVLRKPTATDSRALIAKVQSLRASLHRQAIDSAYPLEETLLAFKALHPLPVAPLVVAVAAKAPPAQVPDIRPAPLPAPSSEPVLRVHGLVSNKDLSFVCVNNRIMGVGGLVEGYKIVKIEPHQVTFDNQKGHLRIIKIK